MADAASLPDSLTSSASSNGMSADIELTLPVTLHTIQTLMVAMTGCTHVKRVFDTDARTSSAKCRAHAHSHLVQRIVDNGLTDTIVAQTVAILPKVTLSVEPKHG